MDIADRSFYEEQNYIEKCIANSKRDVPKIAPNSMCHYCGAPVEPPKLFCDGRCAKNHSKKMH